MDARPRDSRTDPPQNGQRCLIYNQCLKRWEFAYWSQAEQRFTIWTNGSEYLPPTILWWLPEPELPKKEQSS